MSWIGDLGSIIGTVFHFVTSPLESLWTLVFNALLGNPSNPNTPLGFLFQTLTGELNPVQYGVVDKFYQVLAPSSLAILTLIAGLRVMKLWQNEQMTPAMVLMDVVPKWGFMAVLLAPGTNIGYNLFGFVVAAFSQMGAALTGSLLAVTTAGHAGATLGSLVGTDLLTAVAAFVLPGDPMTPLLVIFGLTLAALLIYLIGLMFMRSVILIFCLTLMPLALPIALYDSQNAFYKWWLGSATGAIAAQVIGGAGFAITLGLALDSPGVGPLKAVTTVVMMAVGLTFTTRAVRAAESGTMSGAGIGIGGLVEIGALGPRAVRNVLGSQISSGVSGSFTKLGQARLGGESGSGGGGGGGGTGGGGFDAGPRGMLGVLFPRHNVQADAVGVAAGTVAGAVKGLARPGPEGRGRSLVYGAGGGYRMAMGTANSADAQRAFGTTRAGRSTTSQFDSHWRAVEAQMAQRHVSVLEAARADHDRWMTSADDISAGRDDAFVHDHLARSGRSSASIVQDDRDQAAAELRQRAQVHIATQQRLVAEERSQARAEFDAIRQNAASLAHANAMNLRHPKRVGLASRLTQTQDAHLEAQLVAHRAKYGTRPSTDGSGG